MINDSFQELFFSVELDQVRSLLFRYEQWHLSLIGRGGVVGKVGQSICIRVFAPCVCLRLMVNSCRGKLLRARRPLKFLLVISQVKLAWSVTTVKAMPKVDSRNCLATNTTASIFA